MVSLFLRLFCGGLLTWLYVSGEYYVAKEPHVKYQPVPERDINQHDDYSMTEEPLPGPSSDNTALNPIGNCMNCTKPSQCIIGLVPTCIARVPTICASGACSTTKTSTATSTKVMTTTSTDVALSTNIITQTTTHPVTHTSTAHTTLTSTTTATETKTETHTTVDTKTATSTHIATATSTKVATTTATINSTHTTTSTATLNTTHTGTKTSIIVVPTTQTLYTTKILTTTSTGIVNKTMLTTATEIATSTSTHTTTEVQTQTTTATETLKTTATHLTTDTITATSTHVATATSTAVETTTKTDSVTSTKTETNTQTHHTTATEIHNKTLTQTQTSTKIATSVVTSCSANCPFTTIAPTTTVHTTKIVTSTVLPPSPLPPLPPSTPKPPPPEPACKEALDVGVLVDASDSVNPDDFHLCLQFLSNLTDKFQVSSKGTHFGAIVFSSTPELKFNFGDSQYYNPSTLKAKIMTFERIAMGTRTDLALELADIDLFSVKGGERDSKPNILIVITDGRTDPAKSSPYPVVLTPLQDKNVKTIAVGVGNDVLKDELVEIAMGKEDNVFMVNDYEHLLEYMEKILQTSCVTAPTTAPPTLAPTTEPETPPQCNVKYTKLGCFKDKKKSRALTQLLLNERSSIDWEGWDTWLPGFICRCAQKTKEKNFYYFGAQFYGECYSDPEGAEMYNIHGPSDSCVDKKYEKCTDATVGECAGKKNTNYVYHIAIEGEQPPPLPTTPAPIPSTQAPIPSTQAPIPSTPAPIPSTPAPIPSTQAPIPSTPAPVTGTPAPPIPPELSQCSVKYTKIGCFDDKKKSRALQELILNERSSIEWEAWDTWLPGFICRCAEKTKEKNFYYFGAQYFGECWSDAEGGETYNIHGSSNACVDKKYEACTAATVGECVGEKNTNYVYQIVVEGNPEEAIVVPSPTPPVEYETCHVDFHKIGCYKDDMKNPRPLEELLFTDRDKTSRLYSGIPIDWGNWDSYISDLVCRCAEQAQGKNYDMFGIENFGECWSGLSAGTTYDRAGQSDLCMTTEYATCDSKDNKDCVGNATTLFVYGITKEEVIPCDIQFENVGCYKDNHAAVRPLPELLFTDVDPDLEEYTGYSVQWGQLDRYLADVACRCAENAAEMDYEYFGIQNYGQCYSGQSASQTYKNDGASDQCVHEDYQPCPSNAVEETCVGKEKANYVYRVIVSSYMDKSKNNKHYRRGKMNRLSDSRRKKGH